MMLPLILTIAACAPSAGQREITVRIDAGDAAPISPYIYGVNSEELGALGPNVALTRMGGNRTTAYNWETNASNAGSDYQFQNDDFAVRDLPDAKKHIPGEAVRQFLEIAQSNHAAALITVPTAGFVSADAKGDGDVRKTPDWLNTRFERSYAHKPGGRYQYPPSLTDHAVYQDEFVAWIEKIKSPKSPVWFMLDNEPDLWGSTHAEIWAKNPTYAQIIANNLEFATAIKGVAPDALVFGPANYGWEGFRHFQGAPDANGRDFLNTYLDAMKEAGDKAGHRLLDVLDVHWYPEARGENVRITENSPRPGVALARMQAPRSLWDPKYIETSWISDSLGRRPIVLLPRLQDQIEAHYPGTKLSISEYNYGGANDISGAIAQADVLGIFGRYGVFAACNWGLNPGNHAELAGFKAFQDFDRHGSKFGDRGLAVTGIDPAYGSIYAAQDSADPHRVTVVAINKTGLITPFALQMSGFQPASAKRYTVTRANFNGTPDAGSADVSGAVVRIVVPPLSVTTVEIHD